MVQELTFSIWTSLALFKSISKIKKQLLHNKDEQIWRRLQLYEGFNTCKCMNYSSWLLHWQQITNLELKKKMIHIHIIEFRNKFETLQALKKTSKHIVDLAVPSKTPPDRTEKYAQRIYASPQTRHLTLSIVKDDQHPLIETAKEPLRLLVHNNLGAQQASASFFKNHFLKQYQIYARRRKKR